MAKLAILSLDNQDIQTDARVQRQVVYLARQHQIHLISYGNDKPLDLPFSSIKIVGSLLDDAKKRRFETLFWLSLGKIFPEMAYEKWYWNRPGHLLSHNALIDLHPDLIIANDWWTLPVAAEACNRTGARLILDLHEYAPGEFEHQTWWRILYKPVVIYFLNRYLKSIQASVTVNSAIAEQYQQEFGLRPVVVMNIPRVAARFPPKPTKADRIELIHHGAAIRNRQLELMVDVVANTDPRFLLNFMLIGDAGYIHDLQLYAEKNAPGRVSFLEPVKPDRVVETIAQFDMGVYLTPASSFQFLSMSPNKFFDYLSASLAVCLGPYPVLKALVDRYHCGVVTGKVSSQEMAETLSRLTTIEIDQWKANAYCAGEELNSETEMAKLVQLVNETLGLP